ncbi:MAG: hypothetical protein CL799_00035 [Chromatiales bacterium]|nr:hypothetical protein [Chromatiales bacterium]
MKVLRESQPCLLRYFLMTIALAFGAPEDEEEVLLVVVSFSSSILFRMTSAFTRLRLSYDTGSFASPAVDAVPSFGTNASSLPVRR